MHGRNTECVMCACVHVHMRMCACVSVCVRACVHAYMYVCVCPCLFTASAPINVCGCCESLCCYYGNNILFLLTLDLLLMYLKLPGRQ